MSGEWGWDNLFEFVSEARRGANFGTAILGGWSLSGSALFYDGATGGVSSGMCSADWPFYAGKKFADRATAPFRVNRDGTLYAAAASISIAFDDVTGANKPEDNATVGADWSINLANIPGTLEIPAGAGLYLTSTYMGYWSGTAWKAYIDNAGDFYLDGPSTHYFQWDGSNLEILGHIEGITSSGYAIYGLATTSGTGIFGEASGLGGVGVYGAGGVGCYAIYGEGECYFDARVTVGSFRIGADTISYGANDSGGTGYKLLRVPN